jgi:hypothetical protein
MANGRWGLAITGLLATAFVAAGVGTVFLPQLA